MAYEIYITEALVCGSKNRNTADRSYLLFAREVGMISASARSAREERSKHRYALQDFGLARISLVRGKSGWHITGAESISNLYFGARTRSERILLRNITQLLRRFLQGETPAPALYDDVIRALKKPNADAESTELVLTLRLLNALGYIAPKVAYQELIDISSAHEACAVLTKQNSHASRQAIQEAFTASHL